MRNVLNGVLLAGVMVMLPTVDAFAFNNGPVWRPIPRLAPPGGAAPVNPFRPQRTVAPWMSRGGPGAMRPLPHNYAAVTPMSHPPRHQLPWRGFIPPQPRMYGLPHQMPLFARQYGWRPAANPWIAPRQPMQWAPSPIVAYQVPPVLRRDRGFRPAMPQMLVQQGQWRPVRGGAAHGELPLQMNAYWARVFRPVHRAANMAGQTMAPPPPVAYAYRPQVRPVVYWQQNRMPYYAYPVVAGSPYRYRVWQSVPRQPVEQELVANQRRWNWWSARQGLNELVCTDCG